MPLTISDLLQAGVGVISLFILYQVIQSTSKENERRDAAATADRARQDRDDERRDKSEERMMLLFATITGKQDVGTAQVIKSGVDSESRMSTQITSAENNIKGRVAASADANTAAFEKVYKLIDNAFKIALARPPDPLANDKYDQALAILTAQMEQVKGDLADVKGDVATNTDARVHTAEMTAIVDAPVTEMPAEVIVTAVSPSAVDTIVSAMGAGAATEGGEELREAS